MNYIPSKTSRETARERAAEALETLRDWAASADAAEILALDPAVARLIPDGLPAEYPALSREFDAGFEVTPAYRAGLPDLQNGPAALIRGAKTGLQHVGISNFRLPIRYRRKDGDTITLETSVTGTVSLEADKKGINMSRIMRTFYRHSPRTFSFDEYVTLQHFGD